MEDRDQPDQELSGERAKETAAAGDTATGSLHPGPVPGSMYRNKPDQSRAEYHRQRKYRKPEKKIYDGMKLGQKEPVRLYFNIGLEEFYCILIKPVPEC